MTITVAIPYWGCPDLVERAVRSVLAQTVRDLAVVVIGDGEDPPLRNVRDSRLMVYRLPENRGTYFAHQLMLAASPHEWHAPVDADDWIERDHLARLRAIGGTATATGTIWVHRDGSRLSRWNGPESGRLARFHVGLFATERLREIGGYNPAERIGQDSLTMRLVRLAGPLERTTHPTYHRQRRAGALTTAAETAHRSPARWAMKERNRGVAAECDRLYPDLAAIRAYRASLIPTQIADELAEHVERLRVRLGKPAAA